MLIPFPIGWWVLSLICDMAAVFGNDPVWSTFARYTMLAGVIAAVAAALPGAIDLFAIRSTKVKRIGIWHMAFNLLITGIYVVNFIWRREGDPAAIGPIALSAVAVLLLVVSGWLGGEMVYVYGVGVRSVGQDLPPGD
jgi:uncharacterized membrane protein